MRHTVVLIGIVTGLLLFSTGVFAEEGIGKLDHSPQSLPHAETTSAPRELLVQFTADTVIGIEKARERGPVPPVGIPALDQLFTEYGVKVLTSLFAYRLHESTFEELQRRLAEQAPSPGTSSLDLSRTYRFALPPEANLEEAVLDLKQDSHVEYAEPRTTTTSTVPVDLRQ